MSAARQLREDAEMDRFEQYTTRPRVPFTLDDACRAADVWGLNCGPGAIAAVMGMTLDEVRPHMGDFEKKRYTNPTLMWQVLGSIKRPWQKMRAPLTWPTHGLCRVQWHGPWMADGVPMMARYRMTHWVGAQTRNGGKWIDVFDINAMADGGWVSLQDWGKYVVPHILREAVPRADGHWTLTHVVEVEARSTTN